MGGGRGQTRLIGGPCGGGGQKPFSKLLGGLLGPYSPTPLLLCLCCMYLYALKSVLKGSPFLVHRTDRPTTAPISLCTYIFLAAMGTLHFVFQTFYLLRNILKWDVATIAFSHLVRGYCTGRGNRCPKS